MPPLPPRVTLEPAERAITCELHRTGRDQPDGIPIDATRPLAEVVEDILARCGLLGGSRSRSPRPLAPEGRGSG